MHPFIKNLVATFLVLSALVSCKKKEPTPSAPDVAQPQANVQANAPQAPVASAGSTYSAPKALPPPSPAVAASAANIVARNVNGQVDSFLTQQLRIFVKQKQRLPESFAEFAATRLDSIPGPPSGQKWVIDGASAEVKSVVDKN